MKIERCLGHTQGVEIGDIDLADLSFAEADELRRLFVHHAALLFRNQNLGNQQLVDFSHRFGNLDDSPVNENGKSVVEGFPQLYVVSNILGSKAQPIGSLGSGEAAWHTDMSYLENPPAASLLYSVEVPESGGDTWIADMYAALEHMPASLRASIEGRQIKHDNTYNSAGFVRQGLTHDDNPLTCQGRFHPAICRHPHSAREALYLGRRRNAYIEGLPVIEATKILDRVWQHATQAGFCYCHKWRVGDLIMWDNRATLHRRSEFDANARRLMLRTQIKGDSPPQFTRAEIGD